MNTTPPAQQAARTLAGQRRQTTAHCWECGTLMTGTSRRRYCSDACGQRAFRRRRAQQQGIDARADRDLPYLRAHATQLLALAEEIAGRIVFVPGDPALLMACFYLHRQIDHMRSLLLLGISRDTRLIARTMIEGAAQFAWACEDLPTRAERWRRYAFVYEWRKLRSRTLDGEPEDAAKQAMIDRNLAAFGEEFYSGPARKDRQPGKLPKGDPYVDIWLGQSVRAIFEQVDFGVRNMGEMYATLYSAFSDWQHWNVSGLDEGMRMVDGRFVYSSGDPAEASTSLRAGFFSLWTTVGLINLRMQLGADQQVMTIADAFNSWWEAEKQKDISEDAGSR